MIAKLKPCPFCGAIPTLHHRYSQPMIECENSDCRVSPNASFQTEYGVIEIWNIRAAPQAQQGCRFPLCESAEEQQRIAAQVHAELCTGAQQGEALEHARMDGWNDYDESLAAACIQVGIPDSQYEALCIALEELKGEAKAPAPAILSDEQIFKIYQASYVDYEETILVRNEFTEEDEYQKRMTQIFSPHKFANNILAAVGDSQGQDEAIRKLSAALRMAWSEMYVSGIEAERLANEALALPIVAAMAAREGE